MKINRRFTQMRAGSFIKKSALLCVYLRFCLFLCIFCVLLAGNSPAQQDFIITQEGIEWNPIEAYLQKTIKSGNTEQKRSALLQIRNFKTARAARLAVPALSDSSEIVRAEAAPAIVSLPPGEAAPLLVPLLQRDKSVLVRKEAAYALGKTRDTQAVRPLVEAVRRDKIQEVKDAATVALGEIGDVSAIDALTQILQRAPRDEEEFFRRAAARSTGQIAQIIQTSETEILTPENFLPRNLKETTKPVYANLSEKFPQFRAAVPILIQALQNPRESADAKREAAFALGAIGDESAIPVLQANLGSEDYYLAEIAREALLKLSKQPK
ncbi:MAG: HEAT repeat domain-containing protein [Acidobacteriota bacterium]|nr:HEAT repeat domain-containing protein [Acidobacteriota bacterium]